MHDLTKFTMPDCDARSPVRGMNSLTLMHRVFLSKVLVELLGKWSMETHEGYDGDLTLLLLSPCDSAAILVVSRTSGGFHLHANQSDEIQKIGTFVSIESLWEAVRGMAPVAPVDGEDTTNPASPIEPEQAA